MTHNQQDLEGADGTEPKHAGRNPSESEWHKFHKESLEAIHIVELHAGNAPRPWWKSTSLAFAAAIAIVLLFIVSIYQIVGGNPGTPSFSAMAVVKGGGSVKLIALRPGETADIPQNCTAIVTNSAISKSGEISGGTLTLGNDNKILDKSDSQPLKMMTFQEWASLPLSITSYQRSGPGSGPAPQYPVSTAVVPGVIRLTWNSTGTKGPLELEVVDSDENQVLHVQLDGNENSFELDVSPGKAYFWCIGPVGKHVRRETFRTLSEEQSIDLEQCLNQLGLPTEYWMDEALSQQDLYVIAVLYDIAKALDLHKETDELGAFLEAHLTSNPN